MGKSHRTGWKCGEKSGSGDQAVTSPSTNGAKKATTQETACSAGSHFCPICCKFWSLDPQTGQDVGYWWGPQTNGVAPQPPRQVRLAFAERALWEGLREATECNREARKSKEALFSQSAEPTAPEQVGDGHS